MFPISWTICRVKKRGGREQIEKSVIPGSKESRKMSFWSCINADEISSSNQKIIHSIINSTLHMFHCIQNAIIALTDPRVKTQDTIS
jgi:hypothetical protein